MRRFIAVLPALLLPALLPVRSAHAEVKIGYVDMNRVVQEVDEGKQAAASLEKNVEERRNSIDAKTKSLQAMKADFDKQESVLADEVKKKKQEEMQKTYLELQEMAAKAQDDMQRKRQEVLGSMQAKILQAAQDVADKNNITYVITRDALVVAPLAADLTIEIVRRYNEKFPAAASAATSSEKPKKAPASTKGNAKN